MPAPTLVAEVTVSLSPKEYLLRPRYSLHPVKGQRLSFRWWESVTQRQCACGQPLDVMQYEPAWQSIKEDGCWDGSCPHCGRVVTLYDLGYQHRQPPRGPAPTQHQREVLGWTDDDALAAWVAAIDSRPVIC